MRLTRRQLLGAGAGGLATGWFSGCGGRAAAPDGPLLNDIHSQLNPTRVHAVVRADSVEAVQGAIARAAAEGRAVSIAGGRHAMGGQQFGAGTIHLDMSPLRRVIAFDAERGLLEVEAGIQWPEVIDYLLTAPANRERPWGIAQKQTGADRLSLGGALAANAHGRGLAFKPLIGDVEAFSMVDATGRHLRVSRREHAELFRLVPGGYGLFGVVTRVTLRLAPRAKLERIVQIMDVDHLLPAVERRITEGFRYGDFQYATDAGSPDFLRRGVFSCYRPVDAGRAMSAEAKELSVEEWRRLLYLSHADKRQAFERYAGYYLSTSGQLYWSDTHQLSVYLDDYHRDLDRQLGATTPATEMITEIYVPRPALARFLDDARRDFREHAVDLIYGTIRFIERDDESLLAWARAPWACVIFNLHTVHSADGLARSAATFRRLIDHGLRQGGSYFLTYHRWAERRQVEAAYPQFAEFLRLKRRHDPQERFQSDWYRHYRAMFAM